MNPRERLAEIGRKLPIFVRANPEGHYAEDVAYLLSIVKKAADPKGIGALLQRIGAGNPWWLEEHGPDRRYLRTAEEVVSHLLGEDQE